VRFLLSNGRVAGSSECTVIIVIIIIIIIIVRNVVVIVVVALLARISFNGVIRTIVVGSCCYDRHQKVAGSRLCAANIHHSCELRRRRYRINVTTTIHKFNYL